MSSNKSKSCICSLITLLFFSSSKNSKTDENLKIRGSLLLLLFIVKRLNPDESY